MFTYTDDEIANGVIAFIGGVPLWMLLFLRWFIKPDNYSSSRYLFQSAIMRGILYMAAKQRSGILIKAIEEELNMWCGALMVMNKLMKNAELKYEKEAKNYTAGNF